jgi:diacylglycerol kinase family enzyme
MRIARGAAMNLATAPAPGAAAAAPATPGVSPATPPLTPPTSPPACLPAEAPLFIVLNPRSGAADSDAAAAQITGVLSDAGRPHHLRRVDRRQGVEALAAQAVADARREHGIVVAAGGDGTLNAVARAAHAAGRPFGVIPQGTFNYFAREHGIPTETSEAAAALLQAQPRPVQVGEVNGRIFLVNASLGLYPESLRDREALKRRWGRHRLVALGAALRTLLRGMHPLRVRLRHDGEEEALRLATIFVGNNRLQLEQLGLAEAGALADGRLAAVLLRPLPRRSMLWLLVRGAFGALADASGVRHLAFDELTVSPPRAPGRRWRLSTDGELQWVTTPVTFRTAAQPLWLMLPAAASEPVKT